MVARAREKDVVHEHGDQVPFVAATVSPRSDRSEEVRQMSLGFDGLYGTTHGKFNQSA